MCIREEQCGFRQSRGCIDQVLAVLCKKYLVNGKDVLYFGYFWIWKKKFPYAKISMVCGRC